MGAVGKVMIISAKVGAGHTRAAQAVEEAFHQHYPDVNVRHIDVLEYTNRAFRKGLSSGYAKLIRGFPSVWRLLYERTEATSGMKGTKRLASLLDKLNTRPLRKEVESFDPDRIVCTHFLPSEVLANRRRKGKLRAPLYVALTDYDIHAVWIADGVDHYFVATPAMAYALKAAQVGEATVSVTGIPIVSAFSAAYPGRADMRRRLGLHPERTTILVTTGGFGGVRLDEVVAGLTDGPGNAQFLAVAGRDEELRQALEKLAESKPDTVLAYGFVGNMHELMAASDLAVAKPGGLTSSECLAMGLPMVVVKPIPGQEERNADYLLEAGAAVRAHSIAELKFKVHALLGDPQRLDAMRTAAKGAARPRAAQDIADEVVKGGRTG